MRDVIDEVADVATSRKRYSRVDRIVTILSISLRVLKEQSAQRRGATNAVFSSGILARRGLASGRDDW